MPTSIEPRLIEAPGQGIVRNAEPRHVPPRAWSNGRNARFDQGGTRARKMDGYLRADTTPDNEPVRGLAWYRALDGTPILVRVGLTKAWTDLGAARVEIASGLPGSLVDLLSFTQFEDKLIWTDGLGPPRVYAGGATAAPLGGLDFRSKIVRSHKAHVVHFNITQADGTRQGWRMAWSGLGQAEDYTSLTAGDLDFLETPGDITAAELLGEGIIVHKERGLARAFFVGDPEQYIQEPVPGEDGAIAHGAVVRWGAYQFYCGHHNVYRLGATAEPIGDPIWREVEARLDYPRRSLVVGFARPEWRELWWLIPEADSDQATFGIVYHVLDGTWSLIDHAPMLCFSQFPASVDDTWAGGEDAPWDLSRDIPWNYSPYTLGQPLSYFGQVDGSIQQFGGLNANGQPFTWFLESAYQTEGLTPVRFLQVPLVARGKGSLTVRHRAWLDERGAPPAFPAGAAYPLETGTKPWADVRGYGRLWQLRFEQSGLDDDCQLEAYGVGVVVGGGQR